VVMDCTTFNLKSGQKLTGTITINHIYKDGKLNMNSVGDLSITVTS
jgi:hypothetical protein